MKTRHMVTALALTLLALVPTFASAGDEPEMKIKRQIKIALDDGGDAIEIDTENLEVGDSRQFYADSGKEVVLSRGEAGYTLTVDGKEIELGIGRHHAFAAHGDHGKARVFIHKSGDGEETEHGEHVFVHHGEGEGFHWVSDDSEDVRVVMSPHGHTSAVEHLRAKGLLDELDEDLRERIVAALEELGPGGMRHKVVVVEVDEKVHEGHDEDE